ncbi:unnamed protein product [Rotaria sp. Silwood2]|nr:unnamed protein product [Rotaria sp. Silwood2]CAF2773680.1 unnamed protein product [Rotaria sp. Silwood2]CAF2948974.1 unnamed protein product [Rotaria sp. Silwood2]CAF3882831.1 unnamed protein product [Rotaria sp. Silwood2]CAF3922708.1 unnamed protein product [Rotaria sp. Silwood2]
MANSTRRRLSFVDFPDPQVWHKLIEYAEVTIAFTKLITDFTNQSAKIWFLASSQLHQLVSDFRRKTEIEIRERCHLGGMMYDLWESLLLESELESQSLKKMACLMEKEICTPLASFITNKSVELSINKQHRSDLHEILETSHNIVQELQKEYAKIYSDSGVTPEFHRAHNQYVIELVGVNGLLSKYQYHVLPQLLQGMEQSQIGVIDTVCQNLQLIASLIQNYHEQRHRSFASFVVTSSTTDPNEELENYICSINESSGEPSTPPINIEFEIFHSPFNKLTTYNSRLQHLSPHNSEQLIVYAAPIIQSQLSAHCREAAERLKEVKKEKSALLAVVNKAPTKHHLQHEDQQQSEKIMINQMQAFMKKKHELRLIELEESVLLAQQELLKSHRHSMSSIGDSEQDAQKRNLKNMKGLWRETFRALKKSTTSSSGHGVDESRLMAMMNNSLTTNEQQRLSIQTLSSNRIRSHSLKPRHSKQDYSRRKSAADATSTTITHLELSTENNELKRTNTPPPRRPSTTWFQRRFTVFSFEQQQISPNQQRRRRTGRYSIFNDKSNSNILKQKRASGISQMVESFARRFSLGKKKHNNNESEQVLNETIVDPVYETLKIAAETRKLAVANYLQQRQQTLNKQTSLNSQGSSELDIQTSPKTSRHASRTETEITSSLRPTLPPAHRQGPSATGKRYSTGHLMPDVDKYQVPNRHKSLENSSRSSLLKSSKKE